MPLYTYSCEKHGDFEHSCRLAEWTDRRPCPKCGKEAEQILLPTERAAQNFQPVVVHVNAEGKYRFPGAADAKVPKGYNKVELKTLRDIEQMERKVNQRLRSEADRHNQNEEIAFGQIRSKLRSELVQKMATMSPLGRAYAQFCIARNNARRRKSSEVGFHVEILNYDQANREAHVDDRTGWKRKYY